MNCDVQRSSRIEDTNGKGKKQMQAVRSYLPLDIPVRVLGRSGRDIRKYLYGIIGGLMIETDKESWYCGDECYVIDCRDNVSFTYPVLCVHDEFQVRLIDGSYMPAKEWLKRCQL
jgi:hypothetical protein